MPKKVKNIIHVVSCIIVSIVAWSMFSLPANAARLPPWTGLRNGYSRTIAPVPEEWKKLSDEQIIARVREEAKRVTTSDIRIPCEDVAISMAYYSCDFRGNPKDNELARKSILIMREIAKATKDVKKLNLTFFNSGGASTVCCIAYAALEDSPVWKEMPDGAAVKKEIYDWIVESDRLLWQKLMKGGLHNMNVHGLLRGSGTALLLKDPLVVRRWIKVMDIYLGPNQHSFFNDGVYTDQSLSYQSQVAWRLTWACSNFKDFRDPPGYIDKEMGLKLDGTYSFDNRWPLLKKAYTGITAAFKWPDSSVIALGDTHTTPRKRINPKQIHACPNLFLHHFNCYSIQNGAGENRMMAVMNGKPTALGLPYSWGHIHGDQLGLNLWAGGTEALPDQGYAAYKKGYNSYTSYFFRNPRQHNTVFAWDYNTLNYSSLAGRWSNPDYFAHDDGSSCTGQVSVLHLGCRGKSVENIARRDRLLVMVAVDGGRSYLADISALRGGNRHEAYLIQPEEEDCRLETKYNLKKTGKTLLDILAPAGVPKLVGYNFANYQSFLGSYSGVEEVSGDHQGSFEWIGQNSHVHWKYYLNPVPHSKILFSKAPQLRRRIATGGPWDKFKGWQLTRSRDVAKTDTTIYGMVFDCWYTNNLPVVRGVNWLHSLKNDQGDVMLVSVKLDNAVDYIYTSRDHKPRFIRCGKTKVRFAGSLGIVRIIPGESQPLWMYSFGGTEIKVGSTELPNVSAGWSAPLVAAERHIPGKSDRNALIVKGVPPDEIVGKWVRCVFGKHGSMGLKVTGIEKLAENRSRLLVGMDHGIAPNISDAPLSLSDFTPPREGCRVEYRPVVFKRYH